MHQVLHTLRDEVFARNPGEAEFHQAVSEVFEALGPVVQRHPSHGSGRETRTAGRPPGVRPGAQPNTRAASSAGAVSSRRASSTRRRSCTAIAFS